MELPDVDRRLRRSATQPRRGTARAACACALVLGCAVAAPGRAPAAVGWGTGPVITIDTTPPVLSLDAVPQNLILRGGDQATFHWTAGDAHPGTTAADYAAAVQDAGITIEDHTYLPTPTDASWTWTAPEMQSGYLTVLVTCRDAFGNTTTARTGDFSVVLSSSGAPAPGLPTRPVLAGNFPNPCNPGTTIRFRLPRALSARLDLFAADGTRVRALAAGDFAAGDHDLFWDGRDEQGRDVASGTYLLRLDAAGEQQVHKLALVR